MNKFFQSIEAGLTHPVEYARKDRPLPVDTPYMVVTRRVEHAAIGDRLMRYSFRLRYGIDSFLPEDTPPDLLEQCKQAHLEQMAGSLFGDFRELLHQLRRQLGGNISRTAKATWDQLLGMTYPDIDAG